MKHDPDLGRDAIPAADTAPRAIIPDPEQCAACHLQDQDCSRLAFVEMPHIQTYPDGIAFVDCVQFEKA